MSRSELLRAFDYLGQQESLINHAFGLHAATSPDRLKQAQKVGTHCCRARQLRREILVDADKSKPRFC